MEFVIGAIVGVLVAAAVFVVMKRMRARDEQRRVQRGKLDGVVEGHRQMAEAHASSLDEHRAQALSHRQAAVDHTRKAEALEQRIEREERQATFHEQRAEQTAREREQL
jgi:hypothetical protein